MKSYNHCLTETTFERLREQVTTAAALCSDTQVLELADCLHDALRRRRKRQAERRGAEPRSFAPRFGQAILSQPSIDEPYAPSTPDRAADPFLRLIAGQPAG